MPLPILAAMPSPTRSRKMEEWRTVPSWPDISASSLGRVLLSPCSAKMPSGYIREYQPKPTFGVEEKTATGRKDSARRRIIRVGRLCKTFKVHRLVCEAFHGLAPSEDHIVLHIDEDPSNNRPENLRWGTRKENQNFPKVIAAFRNRSGANSAWAIHKSNQR